MNFAIDYGSTEDFRNAADTIGYAMVDRPRPPVRLRGHHGPANAGEVVGWAYGAEPAMCPTPSASTATTSSPRWSASRRRRTPPLENVEAQMRAGALKDKKAEMYMDIMTGSLSRRWPRRPFPRERVVASNGVSLKFPSIQGAGGAPEPDVVGAAYALRPRRGQRAHSRGQRSLGHRPGHPEPRGGHGQFRQEVNGLNDRTYFRNLPLSSGAPVRLSSAIQEKAEVEDLRQGS